MALNVAGRAVKATSRRSVGGIYIVGPEAPAGGGGGGGYATIQDEGVGRPARTIMNFIGAGIAAADNPGNVRTDITLSPAGVLDGAVAGANAGALIRTGATAYGILQHNLSAGTAPAASNDTTQGYAVGSLWVDTTNGNSYICLDATAANAVWRQITQKVFLERLDPELPAAGGAVPDAIDDQLVTKFQPGVDQTAYFRFNMPPWYRGGDLEVALEVGPSNADTGDYRLTLAVWAQPAGTDMSTPGFAAGILQTITASGTQDESRILTQTFTNAQADAVAAGNMFVVSVLRDGSNVLDDFTGDVHLYAVRVRET